MGGSGPEALANIQATERLNWRGNHRRLGPGEDTSYQATLARNACHFPSESWLRWKEHHEKARAMIEGATDLAGFDKIANDAMVLNAVGEHYLQDSYPRGHLINKGFVMALALDYTSKMTNEARGMGDEQIKAMQDATAHREACQAPQLPQEVVEGDLWSTFSAADFETLKARDPQSALDATVASSGDKEAAELDPSVVNLEQYRTFLNDTWHQKLTNALHDQFCVGGLEMSSPEHPGLFRICGDYNMLRSAEGSAYAGRTSQMSREAITAWHRTSVTSSPSPVAKGSSVRPGRCPPCPRSCASPTR